ncbi:uncharacterized protein LOC116305937 [Actinia tenebrosa]|uniref:Uncharacterized protein LOC116305937 n=1 Tax=Actinia tenebrosa TaxID=6105 RepID=A0A6P8IXB4_ACTTE|nr:uncharacterized protein LOC116305937 [Actinia tenebrosa]XP_031571799.1 uncharacterized protein LOC116305937 [Actinia tenebrosa]
MDQRILFLFIVQVVVLILLNYIPHVYGKYCWIMRDKRDKIVVLVNKTSCTQSNNPCSKLSGVLDLSQTECTCVCPSSKPTYMQTTNNCSAYSDVWSKCNLSFRRQLSEIPIFPTTINFRGLRLNIPNKFRKCKMVVKGENSFYLSESGWSQLPHNNYTFPFLVETKIVRKRLKLAHVKWNTEVPPELFGKVIRIVITCGGKQDCVMLKTQGDTLYQCIVDPRPENPSSSSSPSMSSPSISSASMSSASTRPTRKHVIVSEPSVSNKNFKKSSSIKIPWSIIGTVIGVLLVLLLCLIIMAVCFCRRKKSSQKKRTDNASTQSSGVTLSSTESQPEVTYASPHHPYQELKPPISGTPRGTYQPLKWNAKEDASGYMLPSESTTNNHPDPLYNEIGSPIRGLPPVYDYALPENTVRFSNHLSNMDLRLNGLPTPDARNNPDYVGRASQEQEEPKSLSLKGAASAPVNDGPTSPAYIDFTSEEGANQTEPLAYKSSDNIVTIGSSGLSKYKKPVNVPKSPFKKSPSEERPYQELKSPGSPVYEPLRPSSEKLEGAYKKESKA